MKKIISLVMVIAMAAAMLVIPANAFPAAGELGTAPEAATAPTVDGVKDAAYDNALSFTVDKNLSVTMPFTEAYATVYMVHKDSVLYVFVEVSDSDRNNDPQLDADGNPKLYRADSFEIIINQKNSDNTLDSTQYLITPEGKPYVWDRITDTMSVDPAACDQYFGYAAVDNGDTYTVEFALYNVTSSAIGVCTTINNCFTDGTTQEFVVMENDNMEKVAPWKEATYMTVNLGGASSAPATDTKPSTGLPFTDVPADAAYVEAVKYCYENGYMNGTSDTEFTPDKELNRATIVTVLYRLEGQPEAAYTGKFTDVADGQWYTAAIEWAAANGIVNGVADDRYAPTNALTREQVAAILYRYANLKGYDVSAADDLAAFADKDNISSYAVENVKWAVANKILTAVDGKLAAKDQAARSEIAVAIHAFMTTVVK